MALNRPRVDTNPVACTSVVLGHYKGPKVTTYHETFELNRPTKIRKLEKRQEIAPSEIFRRTEKMFPLTIQQASFGDTPSDVVMQIYNGRKKALKDNMDIHLLNAVPIGSQPFIYQHSSAPNTSQMQSDYKEKHNLLRQWIATQNLRIPKLPPITNDQFRKPLTRTEAKHQFQWPRQDRLNIYQVRFRKGKF